MALTGVEALEERGEGVVGDGGKGGADGLRAPTGDDVEHSIRCLRCCTFGGGGVRKWSHAGGPSAPVRLRQPTQPFVVTRGYRRITASRTVEGTV
jgi:hypothetical protein